MATVAHPKSSPGVGTRALSAADWTRLQRLRGAKAYATVIAANKDTNVPTVGQTPYSVPMLTPRHTGSSRIRRTTTQWTDHIASQKFDYVSKKMDSTNTNAQDVYNTVLCTCVTTALGTKTTGCHRHCGVYTHKTIQ